VRVKPVVRGHTYLSSGKGTHLKLRNVPNGMSPMGMSPMECLQEKSQDNGARIKYLGVLRAPVLCIQISDSAGSNNFFSKQAGINRIELEYPFYKK
jgi:hypothetical protein